MLLSPKMQKVKFYWQLVGKYILIVLIPLILCPIPIAINNKLGYMVFIIALMGTYWVTEALPLPVTALLPMVLFPFFEIRDTPTVIKSYFHDVIFLVFGGLVMAAAIEHQNLHRRFALRVLLLFGTNPRRLMLGFMSATAFLSMWMSNTATTGMMIPIARAVLEEIIEKDKAEDDEDGDDVHESTYHEEEAQIMMNLEEVQNNDGLHTSAINDVKGGEDEPRVSASKTGPNAAAAASYKERFSKGIILSIPYAANVGGTGSLVGTGPNVVCVAVVERMFGSEAGLNFASWTLFCAPQMVICVIVIWAWLQFMYLSDRCRGRRNAHSAPDESKKIRRVIQRSYDKLGPIRFAEWIVIVHFLVLVALWISQDPKVVPGWGSLFPKNFIKSATPAILCTISLCMFPSKSPRRVIEIVNQQLRGRKGSEEGLELRKGSGDNGEQVGLEQRPKQLVSIPAIINWDVIEEKMPWGVLFIVGGGFAIADGCVESGLSAWLGERFEVFYGVPPAAMALITALMISIMTEFIANTVTTTIFLPIIAEMAIAMRINPLYLMVTASVTASFAFMLPVATPPNAIAFSCKEIKVIDMIKTGCLLNFFCILVVLLFMNTLGRAIFSIHVFPDWADNQIDSAANSTDFTAWTDTLLLNSSFNL